MANCISSVAEALDGMIRELEEYSSSLSATDDVIPCGAAVVIRASLEALNARIEDVVAEVGGIGNMRAYLRALAAYMGEFTDRGLDVPGVAYPILGLEAFLGCIADRLRGGSEAET